MKDEISLKQGLLARLLQEGAGEEGLFFSGRGKVPQPLEEWNCAKGKDSIS
jgi:hypothetical protein